MKVKVNALSLKFEQEHKKVLETAPESIDRPGCDHVELTSRDPVEDRIELRALAAAFGSAHPMINIFCDDAPSMAFGDRTKLN
jgi:hypothetical protein